MAHTIKINRSVHLAGHLPMATREISDSISPMLIEQLTAVQLAEVRRCLDRHWHKALAHKEREICGEGYIWDQNLQKLRDLTN